MNEIVKGRYDLTSIQRDKLADIYINVGTLFFGAGVVPYLVPGIDKPTLLVVLFFSVASITLWWIALFVVKR